MNTVGLHNWTGYTALAVSLAHPVLILFSATAGFGIIDIIWPVGAPKQPLVNAFGAVAFWLLVFIVTTSIMWQERRAISRRLWKRFHFGTYGMFPLYAVHALFTDPALKDRPLDPLDAEKVFVEFCILVVVIAIGFRVRHQLRLPPPRSHRPKSSTVPSTGSNSEVAG